jgi:hypothetical protein
LEWLGFHWLLINIWSILRRQLSDLRQLQLIGDVLLGISQRVESNRVTFGRAVALLLRFTHFLCDRR